MSGAALKLTIRAPQPFRKSRRDGVMLFGLSIFSNGAQHANVGKAAAQNSSQRGADFLVRGLRVYVQNGLRCQDYAAEAKPALSGSLLDKRLLYRMRLLGGAETLPGW